MEDMAYKKADMMAKGLTVYAFRNGPIEDMHAKGQISDEDMKVLNKYLVDKLAEMLYLMQTNRTIEAEAMLQFHAVFYASDWDNANISGIDSTIDSLQKIATGLIGSIQ